MHVKRLVWPQPALACALASGLAFSSSALALGLDVSGFATVAFSKTDANTVTNRGIDDDWDINPDSVFGLQFDADINASTSFTLQMTSRGSELSPGSDRFEPELEWAYITYTFDDHHSGKVGRLRSPVFMFSETLDVGFTYPWVSPPIDVYSRVPRQLQGVEYDYNHQFDDWQMTLTAYAAIDETEEQATFENQRGIGLTFSNEIHTARFEFSTIDLGQEGFADDLLGAVASADFASQLSPAQMGLLGSTFDFETVKVSFATLGYMFDNDDYLVISELARISSDNAHFLSAADSGYVTVGKRFGSVMPHITYSQARTTDNNDRDLSAFTFRNYPLGGGDAIPVYNPVLEILDGGVAGVYSKSTNQSRKSVTLGVRWDYAPYSALKFDTEYLTGFKRSDAFFDEPLDPDDEGVWIYRIALVTLF